MLIQGKRVPGTSINVDIKEGVRIGGTLFFLNALLAAVSQLSACALFGASNCSVVSSLEWICFHSVFSIMIPVATGVGFVSGAFSDLLFAAIPPGLRTWSARRKSALAWGFAMLLTGALALFGLAPGLNALSLP